MVHTVFCDTEKAEDTYNRMKKDIGAFMSKDTTEEEEYEFYSDFCNKY